MAIDYQAIAHDAAAAVANAGMAMTITAPGVPAYDPAAGGVTSTPATSPCTGVLLPVGDMRGTGFQFSADLLVQAKAIVYLSTEALTLTPAAGCTLAIGAAVWRVLGVDTLAPAGVPVLHALAVTQ